MIEVCQTTPLKKLPAKVIKINPVMGHVPALDGLRAIAIILVLCAHANFRLADNGVLGVDVFFALSGFLITTLLLEEYQKRNDISLKAFYTRRAFRLFPALYTMLLFVLAYALLFTHGEDKTTILDETLSSALYLNNISWLWDMASKGLMLYHTWSLAVEEQFYLVWPFVLLLALRYGALDFLTAALAIFIGTAFVFRVSGSFTYLATSTIHESIFIGCLAAILCRTIGTRYYVPGSLAAILIAAIVIVGILPGQWYTDIHLLGGNTVVALISSIAIISIISNPGSAVSKFLSTPPLVWIGKISYALYIWHLPIFKFFKYHSDLPPYMSFTLKILVSFLVSWLSWILIEHKATDIGRIISRRLMRKKESISTETLSRAL